MLHMVLDCLWRFLYSSTLALYVIEEKNHKDSQVNWQETNEFYSGSLPSFNQIFH